MAVNPAKYFDVNETISPAVRHRQLVAGLKKTVVYAYRHAPATRALMDQAGVKPADIREYADLPKLPVTRKTDVIALQKINPPYGGFLTVPAESVARVFISPGPIYEPLHTPRIKWFARAFWAAGFRKGDVVVNTFTYHLSPAGMLFYEALRHCGATVVNTGAGNTEIQIQTMRDLQVNGFVGTPSFLMTIIKKAEEMGLDFLKDFHIQKAWFTGEMLAPSVRKILEETYRINTSQAYAVTEPGGCIAYECEKHSGLHMMDDYVIEIIDPLTGKQLPPGEVGEIAVTPIHNKAWGLLRFGTGDLSSYTTAKCACGRTAHRLTGILGRAGDAVKVRGMFVVGKQADEVIMNSGAVSRYQLLVTREGQRDVLTLKAECKEAHHDANTLAEAINTRFQNVCRVKIDHFVVSETGKLDEKSPKITDLRKWD
ncbi:MAG: AMP-binding protein [Dehalococcoidales bacterium]|nr:AMP-binding protein [Dehalococcoidales bacterium]